MEYSLISPPSIFNNPQSASKKEAQDFFSWFMLIKDQRIKILEKAIQTSPGFEKWNANFTLESLAALETWLKTVTEKRKKTQEEIREDEEKILSPFKDKIHTSLHTLTNLTVSIAFDAGIYMAETLRHNNSSLFWELCKSKTFDINQPVLSGFKSMSFNPRLILQNFVGKLANNKEANLTQLYQTWTKYIG